VARAAAQGVSGVLSADADMSKHSVTVKLNDPKQLDAVIKALNDAGYTVGTPKLLEAEKKS
jgi:copper chaperone CopZ